MILFPNAKINIGLNIINKRNDGYHNIETVLFPVKLEFMETETPTRLIVTGNRLDVNPTENLVFKAWELLHKQFKIPNIEIRLHKIIPSGAGLGGGSSDAAFMLKYLVTYFNLNISLSEVERLAEELGSDCPFFVKNSTVFAHEKGTLFSPVEIDLNNYHLIIIKPNINIPTKTAYESVEISKKHISLMESINQPVNEWKNHISNDFEKSIFKKFPELEQIKHTLYKKGALYAQMSGSGSAIFGIFEMYPDLKNYFKNCFFYEQVL